MNSSKGLEILPINFRHEKKFLIKNNLDSWFKLKNLKDSDINKIVSIDCFCTTSRLKKIKAIAVFIVDLELCPHEAYLLLHCGIGSIKSLSLLNPHLLANKIGRLERNLRLKSKIEINISSLKTWIDKAKELC
tara:strand:+ start:576 stop:974 length:399 start_codon:yes stop_codon:yes gene_type:complete